jgi:hypothetical protein
VTSVAIVRAAFQNEERVTLTAGVTNRGGTPIANVPVKLEIDGRVVGTRNVSVGPNASGSVTFDTLTVSESHMRATVTRPRPTNWPLTTRFISCCRRAGRFRCCSSRAKARAPARVCT